MSETQMPPTMTAPIANPWVGTEAVGHAGLTVLAWSWLYPRRAAARAAHWGLKKCFLVHFVVAVMGAVLIPSSLIIFHESAADLLGKFSDVAREIGRDPIEFGLGLCGLILLIEGLHLALALVLSAWGGLASERLRDALGWSLGQLWLRTPHGILIAFLIATTFTSVEETVKQWRMSHSQVAITPWPTTIPTPPGLQPADHGYPAAMRQYRQQQREYQTAINRARQSWMEKRRSEPWYVRNDEQVFIVVFVLLLGWWLAALLAAIGARRTLAAEASSPLCLWCGYDLSMTGIESRCPECGEAVVSSLGADAQPGAAWEHRTPENRLRSWWQTWRAAVGRPVAFGRSLRLCNQSVNHRKFLLVHLVMVFVVGAAGAIAFAVTMSGFVPDARDKSLMTMVGFIFSVMCVMGATLVTCGVASVTGWIISLQNKRNLLPAAMQVAAYASPYLVAWALLGAVVLNCAINLEMNGWFPRISGRIGFGPDLLFFLCTFVPNLVCGIVYLALVARGTYGARHANR